MRFMVIVKADKNSEAGVMPSREILTAMGKYNEELVKAGVMLAGEGLHPTSKGKRVKFSGGKHTITDGPFAETKELIAGFWLWQVRSMDEAIEWLKRSPFDGGTEIESSPGVRDGGLRSRIDSRTERARGTPAQANCRKKVSGAPPSRLRSLECQGGSLESSRIFLATTKAPLLPLQKTERRGRGIGL